jgi:hypothetical protein
MNFSLWSVPITSDCCCSILNGLAGLHIIIGYATTLVSYDAIV